MVNRSPPSCFLAEDTLPPAAGSRRSASGRDSRIRASRADSGPDAPGRCNTARNHLPRLPGRGTGRHLQEHVTPPPGREFQLAGSRMNPVRMLVGPDGRGGRNGSGCVGEATWPPDSGASLARRCVAGVRRSAETRKGLGGLRSDQLRPTGVTSAVFVRRSTTPPADDGAVVRPRRDHVRAGCDSQSPRPRPPRRVPVQVVPLARPDHHLHFPAAARVRRTGPGRR